jgi:maltooligosyltrehalose trehalohydrolase
MIFMGDEHGERAPFQFFSDHIDEDIATATRRAAAGSSPPSPSSRRGGSHPQERDLRELQVHRKSEPQHSRALSEAAARPQGLPRRADAIEFDGTPAGCGRPRPVHTAGNFARNDVHVPENTGVLRPVLTTHPTELIEPASVSPYAPVPEPCS